MRADTSDSSEIRAIVDAQAERAHSQDVGPLFGQLAVLARELRHAPATRVCYTRAVAAALGVGGGSKQARVVWTRLIVRAQRSGGVDPNRHVTPEHPRRLVQRFTRHQPSGNRP